MLRAYAFVTRAFQTGLIDTDKKSLLVVGGGSTGMTVALTAAVLGVDTTVIERRRDLVFRLAECPTRDVDPTLYDWPADHWRSGRFPIAGATMPLPWDRGLANDVAVQWRRELAARATGKGSNPKVIRGAWPVLVPKGKPPAPDEDGLTWVTVEKDDGTNHRIPCGALVSCVGWHEEITGIEGSAFKEVPFWNEDRLQEPLRTEDGRVPSVLISGGGDGALQDLIRIATNLSAREVIEGLVALGGEVAEHLERCRNDLKYHEDVAQRALTWGMEERHDDPVLERLERAHEAAVARLEGSSAWDGIQHGIRGMLVTPLPRITLAHSRPAFTQCYALNRFLALLILKVAGDGVTRLRKARVDAVVAQEGHACTGRPSDCHLKPHAVTLKVDGKVRDPKVFDVIVLRFGLDADRSLFIDVPARVRHLLPYFIEPDGQGSRPRPAKARGPRGAKVEA